MPVNNHVKISLYCLQAGGESHASNCPYPRTNVLGGQSWYGQPITTSDSENLERLLWHYTVVSPTYIPHHTLHTHDNVRPPKNPTPSVTIGIS
ncbi:uncharacterized protein LAJ45_07998 [Morchella importuna]|uniref:uncharacterized protein n=1 Tax=Morchella importuna TaxID=1174673 RepID=UPI001E8DBD9F|nr:uncharacterized protein LAJ45_07998 [Morchella importuna]KAH8147897.1 hypothetical protein LAJ45_07998 [Morchella importuna]